MDAKNKVGDWVALDRNTGPTSDIIEVVTLDGLVRNIAEGIGRVDAHRIARCVNASAELAQLRADNAVLAREVNAHRQMWWSFRGIKMDIWRNGDTRITLGETIPASSVASAIQATDASAALERARGTKP